MLRLRKLGLINGVEPLPPSLLEACHEGRLVGGLSLSVKATADEVVGPLSFAMGGSATQLKVLDSRAGVLDVRWGQVEASWPVETVEALIHYLGDLFLDEEQVKALVVLGEWEDMLQVWALAPDMLDVLLSTQILDGAWNITTLRERHLTDL